jgi:hypothetical protein
MKIRTGFVSNSSSTSFTFCYKGEGIKPLTDLILTKYRNRFELSYDEWHCNAQDVVEAIEGCFGSKNEYDKITPVSIDQVIRDVENYLADTEVWLEEESRKNKDSWLVIHYSKHIQKLQKKISRLKNLKKEGLTTVLIVGFGDNDGNISGGNVGNAMDYEGRNIDINNDDLVVFTEQNR